MKRKEAARFIDDMNEHLANLKVGCKAGREEIDILQIKVGLMSGLAFTTLLLEDEITVGEDPREEVIDLLMKAIEFYLFKEFEEEGDKTSKTFPDQKGVLDE